eukprot:741735-Pyramimonas_sp.AAC.1
MDRNQGPRRGLPVLWSLVRLRHSADLERCRTRSGRRTHRHVLVRKEGERRGRQGSSPCRARPVRSGGPRRATRDRPRGSDGPPQGPRSFRAGPRRPGA